jgi:hypothetical protein
MNLTPNQAFETGALRRPLNANVGPSNITSEWKGPLMPLLHISLRAGKPKFGRQAVFDSLYRAMREAPNARRRL